MADVKWTKAQEDALKQKNPVVVSAAAGSGKTAVLVERVLRKVIEDGKNIDDFLIVTFTNMAASEMKEKISDALYAKLAEDATNAHLQEQTLRMGRTHISTVHGFCESALRRYSHCLNDLPAQFRIADETEISTLKEDVLSEIIRSFYEKNGIDFSNLVAQISCSKNDNNLADAVKKLSGHIASLPDEKGYQQKVYHQLQLIAEGEIFSSECLLGREILHSTKDAIDALKEASEAIEAAKSADQGKQNYRWLDKNQDFISALELAYRQKDYSKIYEAWKMVGSDGDVNWKDKQHLNVRVNLANKLMKKAKACFCCDEQKLKEEAERTIQTLQSLFTLLEAYEVEYKKRKKEAGILDFNDLERFALELFSDADGKPSAVAQELAGEFEEIYVDEYQDTNYLQDKIFSLIAREIVSPNPQDKSWTSGKNIFFVGDIKQSIYRFRDANPKMFLHHQETDRTVLLSDNFRSKSVVVDCVNEMFGWLMSQEVGDSNYGTEEALKCNISASLPDVSCELAVLTDTPEATADANEIVSPKNQAEYVAWRIHQMLEEKEEILVKTGKDSEGKPIYEPRPVTPDDIVILTRNKKHFDELVKALFRYAIEAQGEGNDSFFKTEEIMTVTSLLKVIDNPEDDIALAATLACPIFSFTPEELATVRMDCPTGSYYQALKKTAEKRQGKYQQVLETLAYYREMAKDRPADTFLQDLLEETQYETIVSSLPKGEQRKRNLTLLQTIAKNYENNGFKGLFYFNRHLSFLQEEDSFSRKNPLISNLGKVRIMTVHASKGLEFPVVFLPYLETDFNTDEARKQVIFDSELGLGIRLREPERFLSYPTPMYQGILRKYERESASEELRLLYVAMTRAKDRLILVGAQKHDSKGGFSGIFDITCPLKSLHIRCASNPLSWVLSVLTRHKNADTFCEELGVAHHPLPDEKLNETKWVFSTVNVTNFTDENALNDKENEAVASQELMQEDETYFEDIKSRLQFVRNENPAPISTVTTVSKIKKQAELDLEEYVPFDEYAAPRFAQGEEVFGAERGTALHNFLQFADYGELAKEGGIKRELDRLRGNFITERQADACDENAILGFVRSDLFKRMIKNDLLREKRFGILLPQSEVERIANPASESKDETPVYVQGIIDCLFFEGECPVLVDYKTDYVKTPEELISRYRVQMEVYARAVEELYHKKPVKIIYSLHLAREIVLE